jgi:hypothetical protein
MRLYPLIFPALVLAAPVWAAPLIPTLTGHDLQFGAHNGDGQVEYATNGTAPDTLVFTRNDMDHEVSAYWPSWPSPPMLPVWDLSDPANFGGDLVLGVKFDGQDAPIGPLTVSLTGRGLNENAPDLEIWGKVTIGTTVLSGLLWALDLQQVSLYGYANSDAYVLEGTGTIADCLIAENYPGLIGSPGAMRGHLDFLNRPAGWLTPLYDPLGTAFPQTCVRAAYSGETGLVPEPGAMSLLLLGVGALLRRR